ncbi:MAG: 16S rRNA (cytidine(1402)-2'-O)-methyltransferase [Clostridia bacterium]|nr:16S rRNA (cytidine(1402)-2'-O)-methyltransferase [Clostridia bacterium]
MRTEEKNKVQGGVLYLVSTPIGNLSDMSERAIKVLSEVDFIAAEDTRNTLKLLNAFGISKSLVSYFEHNKAERGIQIAERLEAGESCALVTDAGTPAISDPGEDLVRLCAERGITVTAIPGACAGICALTLSALATERFCFEGFLSAKKSERKKRLETLAKEERTMIFHEAPHKLRDTLTDMAECFGENRKIALCRELTKLNEEVMRVTLGGAVAYYKEHDPRGEYVLVLEGAPEGSAEASELSDMSPREQVELYMAGGMSKMDAIKKCAKERGVPKNDIYKLFAND